MVTLTDVDIIQLLRKNNLNQDTLQEDVVAKLRELGLKEGDTVRIDDFEFEFTED